MKSDAPESPEQENDGNAFRPTEVLLRSYCFYVSVMCLSCVCHPGRARTHHQFKQIQTSWQSKGLRTLVALSWKSHGYTPEVLIFYFDFLHVQFAVSTVSNVYVLITDSLPEVYLKSKVY